MTLVNCPFCGVATDVRHETQQACIDALHAEIARTRHIIDSVTDSRPPRSEEEERDPQLT